MVIIIIIYNNIFIYVQQQLESVCFLQSSDKLVVLLSLQKQGICSQSNFRLNDPQLSKKDQASVWSASTSSFSSET